jgi:hypothetical protein
MQAHEHCEASELLAHFAEEGIKQKRRSPGIYVGTEISRHLSEVDPTFLHVGNAQYTMYVIFNIGCYGWHYGWRGGRFKQNARHVFSISIIYRKDRECKVLGEFRSSEFRVISVRHATVHTTEIPNAVNLDTPEGVEDSSILDNALDGGDLTFDSVPKKRPSLSSSPSFSAEIPAGGDIDDRISKLSDVDAMDYRMLLLRHGCSSELTLKPKRRKRKCQESLIEVGGRGTHASRRCEVRAQFSTTKSVTKAEPSPITPEILARVTPTGMCMNPEASAEKQPVPRCNSPRFMASPDGWWATTPALVLSSSVAKTLRNTARADVGVAVQSPAQSPVAVDSGDLPADVIEFLRSACSSPIFRHSGGVSNTHDAPHNSIESADGLQNGNLGPVSKFIDFVGRPMRFDSGRISDATSSSASGTSTSTTLLMDESNCDHGDEPDIRDFFSSLTPYQI